MINFYSTEILFKLCALWSMTPSSKCIWLWKDKDAGIRITLMEMSLMLGKIKTVGKTKIRIGLINMSPVHFHPSSPDRHPLSQKTFVGLHILVGKHLNYILILASALSFSLFLFFPTCIYPCHKHYHPFIRNSCSKQTQFSVCWNKFYPKKLICCVCLSCCLHCVCTCLIIQNEVKFWLLQISCYSVPYQ